MAHCNTSFSQILKLISRDEFEALKCLENGLEDALTVMLLPEKYRRRLRTSNMNAAMKKSGEVSV